MKSLLLHKKMDDLFIEQAKELNLKCCGSLEQFVTDAHKRYGDICRVRIEKSIITYGNKDSALGANEISFVEFLSLKPELSLDMIIDHFKTPNYPLQLQCQNGKYIKKLSKILVFGYDKSHVIVRNNDDEFRTIHEDVFKTYLKNYELLN